MTTKNPLVLSFSRWMQRNFSTPGAIGLFFFLLFGFLFIEFFGGFFLPVIISVVLAYLLNSLVNLLTRCKIPHLLAVIFVYLVFIGLFLYIVLGLFPMLWKQLIGLVGELPHAFAQSQAWVTDLMQRYPRIFSGTVVQHVSDFFKNQVGNLGQYVVQFSVATIANVVQVVLYLVLVPLLVFFFTKDSKLILNWFNQFMPKDKSLVLTVWSEVNEKIGCYIRGRVIEIFIVAIITSVAFVLLGLQYAVLLGFLVGLSVLIPYIGAIVVTIPVLIVGLMEWGLTANFLYLVIVYTAIVVFDGYVLVAILFSETMDLHPVVIILSVVIFGGLWGFWGVFFAIPLTTFFNAILHAWPKTETTELNS